MVSIVGPCVLTASWAQLYDGAIHTVFIFVVTSLCPLLDCKYTKNFSSDFHLCIASVKKMKKNLFTRPPLKEKTACLQVEKDRPQKHAQTKYNAY